MLPDPLDLDMQQHADFGALVRLVDTAGAGLDLAGWLFQAYGRELSQSWAWPITVTPTGADGLLVLHSAAAARLVAGYGQAQWQLLAVPPALGFPVALLGGRVAIERGIAAWPDALPARAGYLATDPLATVVIPDFTALPEPVVDAIRDSAGDRLVDSDGNPIAWS